MKNEKENKKEARDEKEKISETRSFIHGLISGFGSLLGGKIVKGLRDQAYNFGLRLSRIVLGGIVFILGIIFLGVGTALFLGQLWENIGAGFAVIGVIFVLSGWILKIKP